MREPRLEAALAAGGTPARVPLWRASPSRRLRELAWCTLSPQLLERLPDGPGGATPARWPVAAQAAWERWLQAADPERLPPTIDELAAGERDGRSLRLGRHAERLLHFALERCAGLELLAANLPVRRASARGVQTLGELDFVWRDRADGAIVHWEMAAKFYLLVEAEGAGDLCDADEAAHLRHFVGPNLVDRLADKLDHTVRRQLPLGRSAEALALLGQAPDRSEAYLLGWLFYRDGRRPDWLEDAGFAPDHLHGWWSTLPSWSGWAARQAGARWCRLSRSQWLSGALVSAAQTLDAATLQEELAGRFAEPRADRHWRRESPVMVCELEPAGAEAPGMWREVSRGFVVPLDWEQRARLRAGGGPAAQGSVAGALRD
ncbi:DUF1853 family protein [Cupriavidus malaysiensis]|uniref:DUF1853 family protein n=1 Tax=Cupriavidus malaysiensis TaxID=367825 RepID=A0A1D9I1Z4_9BURK|nr:DUF1853 family protein [Cupriavidus malaysiensis]AOZ06101.1 hypothetical protein BKK80_09845 [Cupriavidus malaysiensis]